MCVFKYVQKFEKIVGTEMLDSFPLIEWMNDGEIVVNTTP